MPDEESLTKLHYLLVKGMVERHACPTNAELAQHLGIAPAQLEANLNDLSAIHGVVLHPHICEPWVVHPFSVTPTANWVEGQRGGWWVPCVWCALGVAALAKGETRLHTRFAGEAEPLTIPIGDGTSVGFEDLWSAIIPYDQSFGSQ